jgi:hypothetical protein
MCVYVCPCVCLCLCVSLHHESTLVVRCAFVKRTTIRSGVPVYSIHLVSALHPSPTPQSPAPSLSLSLLFLLCAGLFATRTPHRPNPIGLTVARLVRVEGRPGGGSGVVLHIAGHDLVDGTPVLDVKPFLPSFDAVQGASGPAWTQVVRERLLGLRLACACACA